MQYATWIWVIGAVILLFGAAVFVHELGHFLVARWCGLKVEGFSIGFGPKIFGWKRDGIDYAWRWIPAGGFVKLPQMVTSQALEGKAGEEPLPPAPPGAKILVALAGPIMNGIFAFLLATIIYFVGLPIRVNPAVIGEVPADSAEGQLGIRTGDRILAVNGKPVNSWEDVQLTAALALTNVLLVRIERDGVRADYHLRTKVNEELGWKLLDLEPMEHPVVAHVRADSAAQEAGLQAGDEILSFAGVPVVGQDQFVRLIQGRGGVASVVEIKRGGRKLAIPVTPRLDPVKQTGFLGVEISPNLKSVFQVQKPGPLPWVLVSQICQDTFSTLGALVHSKQTGIGVKDLSGPPGILAMLAAELKIDYRLGLKFMVLLNVSLAILNLLPLPVLDGGHIAMAVLEKIRGRPLSPRVQEYATSLFALLLISLMVYVSYNDIVRRFPLFRTLFQQEVQIHSATNAPAR